jgi:DNA-binding NarL/FixJ family response regulator
MKQLTKREIQILDRLLAEGESQADLAVYFEISELTVKKHICNILDKTGYGTTLELVVRTFQERQEIAKWPDIMDLILSTQEHGISV